MVRLFPSSPRLLSAAMAGAAALCCALTASPAFAQAKGKKAASANEPKLVSTHGDWGVYVAQSGKSKTCYALGRPKKRAPATLKRDDGFIFVSIRPSQGVRNEVSIIMGFDVRDDSNPEVRIGSTKFEMHAKGGNLWVKNAAEEKNFVGVMRKGSELAVNATSRRGNKTTDTYSLSGLGQALDRAAAACK